MIDGGRYLKTMFGLDGAGIGNSHTAFMLLNYRFVLLMGIIGSTSLAKRLSNRLPAGWDAETGDFGGIVCIPYIGNMYGLFDKFVI